MLSEIGCKEQGAIPPPPKGSFVYRLSDGRKIAYTAVLKIEDLSTRKGGGFDPVYQHKDRKFWLTPEEGSNAFGVVIRETGIKEAFVGLAEPKKVEKKNDRNTSTPPKAEGPESSREASPPPPQS